jgi:hypothetical protein
MLKPQEAFSHERGLDLSRLTDEQLEELYVLAGGKPYLAEERKAKAEARARVAAKVRVEEQGADVGVGRDLHLRQDLLMKGTCTWTL